MTDQRILDKRIASYALVLELDPRNYWATLALGDYYLYKLADFEAAYDYLVRAIELQPDEWFAYQSLSELFDRQGDLVAAATALEMAARLKQKRPRSASCCRQE